MDGILECQQHGKIHVGAFSYIGRARAFAAGNVSVGRGVQISVNVIILDSNPHPLNGIDRFNEIKSWHEGGFPDVYAHSRSGFVAIHDYVCLGANSVVTKGARPGRGPSSRRATS